jgi:MoxR-like ATPase
VLTSNATRELSEALRRRCLFLHIDYPAPELEQRIVQSHVPELPDALAASIVRVVGALRALELRKAPSVAETVDWAGTLLSLGARELDPELVRRSLGVVLKHHSDLEVARRKLDLDRDLAG